LPRIVGRGVAAADFDNDGRVDIAVTGVGAPLQLLRNTGEGGHWLTVSPEGALPGTRVSVTLPDGRRLVRELQAGGSYLSSEDPRLHFGLGETATVPLVETTFPDGTRTRLENVAGDRVVRVERRPWAIDDCRPATGPGRSVARVWDEAILAAIRTDLPAPTTHARNLFHLSAAMWDAWAAYDPTADGVFVTEKPSPPTDIRAAREAAISFAAYRLLTRRYALGAAVRVQLDRVAATMRSLCYRVEYTKHSGDDPAALGNRIAAAVIAAGRDDGANEEGRYADETYRPVNEPLIVNEPGAAMRDPTRWQPLALDRFVSQNGLPVAGKVQAIVGAQWGDVRSFALPAPRDGLPIDPGPPPLGLPADPRYKAAAVEVLRSSASLDPGDATRMDIGLGARGNNPLGTNDGRGYPANPVTGQPYAPDVVPVGDYGRALAEYWADGPQSETPPGHWNVIANLVSDAPETAPTIGTGSEARLRWDVRMYLALNGALHDAAIAAGGAKRRYDSARPISMIRYLAGRGQSSDRSLPSFDPDGLPLVPGLVEVVTAESSAPGGRHSELAGHVGEIAVRAWRGTPPTPGTSSGVGWILGTRWVPYQRDTFVTPAFPGYVSGHSTFSRAAAEVLSAYLGSPAFPGGELAVVIPIGSLGFEKGPSVPVTLRAATFFDAADQAGLSRLYGGIHVSVDDLAGRRLGAIVGKRAWARATAFFAGAARP
ncbi:MAG: phosphatase PAP2 family protein, partial [Actinobacteria bacterium]|nr:phosphatase PAP2 family protein [Actinomycetota bacterium]